MNFDVLVSDFIKENLGSILALGKKAYNEAEETLQINLKTAYKDYLKNSSERYAKSKSFFIRNDWVDLYTYYVPSGVSTGKKNITEPDFNSCIDASKRVVICGTGGSGKSILVKHLFLDCIKKKKYVPILVELRELNTKELHFDGLLKRILENFGFNVNGQYVEKAKKAGHFCFFLDGYDEVSYALRNKLIQDIKTLLRQAKDCPIFISSRPDDTLDGLEEFTRFNVLPLQLETASRLIKKLPYEEGIKSKFIEDLKSGLFEEHQSFLSNPLLLSIMLLTYGENAEIPSKLSIFYNQAYEALFQRHDARKGGFVRDKLTSLDIQDFSRIFAFFCLLTYDKRKFKFPTTECLNYINKSKDYYHHDFITENYLSDLLSATCLLIEDGLDVAFSHRSFQEYFVALYISRAPEEVQKKLINKYWKNMRSDNVIDLLLEINPEIIENFLLKPKLEELFSNIGVKRKVGITHAFKYLKLSYSTILFVNNQLLFGFHGRDASYSDIVKTTNHHLSTFSFDNNKESRKEFIKELCEKYGEKFKAKEYSLQELTFKHPLVSAILLGDGNSSISNLQAAYDAYKQLKHRSQKKISTLDDLLGLAP